MVALWDDQEAGNGRVEQFTGRSWSGVGARVVAEFLEGEGCKSGGWQKTFFMLWRKRGTNSIPGEVN